MTKDAILSFTLKALTRARQNAKGRRGIEFTLVREDVRPMLVKSGWRCKVTGVEFSMEKVANRLPFAPSIDRINSAQGYVVDNCRIVCVAANYAMNAWGDQVLKRLIRAGRILDEPGRQIDNDSVSN